ncbi:hypothetical protein MGYG_09095 [Nannizzia gypsea CBS 118893]|uniref:Uncharacterized protein n=1 Tax=Arthroderma gypseum (strain ATCC MYA-4604 / CBS 118893) TaxID=535722 RepID=E4UX10_ARTGP|nr:hypothetical protein MGYG_09095 [Nannizzia gypsea CBS 118893]EFR02649.1 hypothetical protein MGYG_09095 [Nannizzia gypsea CBS 118893]
MAEANPGWEGPGHFWGRGRNILRKRILPPQSVPSVEDACQYSLACRVLDLIPATRIWGEGPSSSHLQAERKTKKKREKSSSSTNSPD